MFPYGCKLRLSDPRYIGRPNTKYIRQARDDEREGRGYAIQEGDLKPVCWSMLFCPDVNLSAPKLSSGHARMVRRNIPGASRMAF